LVKRAEVTLFRFIFSEFLNSSGAFST